MAHGLAKAQRRIVLAALLGGMIVFCCVSLSACTGNAPPAADPAPQPAPAEVEPAPLPAATLPPENADEPDEPPADVYPIQLNTTPPRNYQPLPVGVAPLINVGGFYKHCIVGELSFIRRDGTVAPIPKEARFYDAIYDYADGSVAGYALHSVADDSQTVKYAFMDAAGNIKSGFDYTPTYGEDYYIYPCRYGYLTVSKATDEYDRWGYPKLKQGLLDLTTMKMVIKPQYDTMELLSTIIYAQKDGQYYLLDYSGEVLFDCGDQPLNYIDDPGYSMSIDAGYTLFTETGEFYKGQADAPPRSPRPDEYMRGHIRVREEKTPDRTKDYVQLEDENGNVLIPFGTYDELYEYPPFVMGCSEEYYTIGSGNHDFDILNQQGKVLVHNPLGAIFEAIFPDAMVVWLDEQTCILLTPDGRHTVLENAPSVEYVYYGG